MGRKRWWQGGLVELLVLCILHHAVVLADGDVGCLFSDDICDPQTEKCFDDLAFGKCVPQYTNLENDDLYRYNLDIDELELLQSVRLQLMRLESDGYKWKHPFTQCIVQTLLHNLRYGQNDVRDFQLCQYLMKPRLDEQDGLIDEIVPAIAILRISTDDENPESNLADVLYHPTNIEDKSEYTKWRSGENDRASINDEKYDNAYEKSLNDVRDQFYPPRMRRFSFDDYKNDVTESLEDTLRDETVSENDYTYDTQLLSDFDEFLQNEKSPDYTLLRPPSDDETNEREYERVFSRKYKHRKKPLGLEFSDADAKRTVIGHDEDLDYENSEIDEENSAVERSDGDSSSKIGIYTEGGIVRPMKYEITSDASGTMHDDDLDALLWRRELAGFKRRERLDVKKPGPPFSTNNYAFKTQPDTLLNKDYFEADNQDNNEVHIPLIKKESPDNTYKMNDGQLENYKNVELDYVYIVFKQEFQTRSEGEHVVAKIEDLLGLPPYTLTDIHLGRAEVRFKVGQNAKNYNATDIVNNIDNIRGDLKNALGFDIIRAGIGNKNNEVHIPLIKKELPDNTYKMNDGQLENYKNIELDYVYIVFKQVFHTWIEGEHVVAKVEELLGLPPCSLTDIRVGRAEVTFKVVQNDKNYNATDIVNNIDNIRGDLKNALGLEVIQAGIGNKVKLPATLEIVRESEMNSSFYGALVAAGVAAAIAAAVVTLIIARRHAKYRAKLAGLATPDPEASKDYQDLCRARMQAKQPSEKLESPRITSLSRENESNLPSNRSSTSSWGEEPTLSNMDISTGHMVLSYMEDHLKNKDRLDQEWGALCAYEAEPSSTEIAESEVNIKQNRPNAALPYDHSRVVLNDLANANNSDYINASTITDHDPRNPAYIATQGPLPQTTADFWQLVWEQGSVVIVMLTRLTEEGRAMCHRYWPEEGSELYHIYEVHLVSEHFWCDDYLVRSFYLKNLRTCETRTVTQFHFLSWPENSVPYSTKALLEFRRKVNKSYRGRSCPIVVHCSDGAGRTGTYCLIDMVLNRMTKGAKEIDIAATLEHIRDQRPNMVATKQQFEFVLMAVAEEVHAILKALPISSSEKSVTATGSSPPTKTEQ